MKMRVETIINLSDWDTAVTEIYGKPYSFQQQEGCRERGIHWFDVPDNDEAEDYKNTTISSEEYSEEMGVSLESWKARDPKEPVGEMTDNLRIDLWWKRRFFPDFQTLANDMHRLGKLKSGRYGIEVDW